MLAVGWVVLAVVVAVLLSMWVTFTLTRLDRLHARVDAARNALDAELARRAAALQRVAETSPGIDAGARRSYDSLARDVLAGAPLSERQASENAVSRAMLDLTRGPAALDGAELREAAARVQVARRFYNDAVRDTRALRAGRLPRLLHLAGHVGLPLFFDIDDTLPPDEPISRPEAPGHVPSA